MIKILFILMSVLVLAACNGQGVSALSSDGGNNIGRNGSLARFSIVDDMLYAIVDDKLQLIDITDPAIPVLWSRVNVQFGIETLFAYGDYLFIGSQTGVFIYDNTKPAFPRYLSMFTHARSCDPVVVQGTYAFVTLRGNGRCWGGLNQLDILDVTNVAKPSLVKSYALQEPTGLGIDGDKLFICDGRAGLKLFNVEDKNDMQIQQTLSDVECYDVIPYNNVLLISVKDRILQYSYATDTLTKLSEIVAVSKTIETP